MPLAGALYDLPRDPSQLLQMLRRMSEVVAQQDALPTFSNRAEFLAWFTDKLERSVSGRTEADELGRRLPWVWKAERLAATIGA